MRMSQLSEFHSEIFYLLGFFIGNSLNYLINYIYHFNDSRFLPYVKEIVEQRRLGLVTSVNQDVFRYHVEFSIAIIVIRWLAVTGAELYVSGIYIFFFLFNLYQYSFRRIYESEPNLYSDSKLLKNGLAIVWHESKLKVFIGSAIFVLILCSLGWGVYFYVHFVSGVPNSGFFYSISIIWGLSLLWAVIKRGLNSTYPNDINRRYHFVLVEFYLNFRRSINTWKFTKAKIGEEYSEARLPIKFSLSDNPPNVHFIFIESYGSYFFKEKSLIEKSAEIYKDFTSQIKSIGWSMVSNYSESPITGGQSWLTYSSMLYGLRLADNTYFESCLNDPVFRQSKGLLRIFKEAGYVNYNLNPIKPIKGINVPYSRMKEFYCIDEWILHENLPYTGDVYGFGECAPDQFSMNFSMELIKKANRHPYTFFYLTKNSHSPFIAPDLVENWRSLNHANGQTHVHKGFLKTPLKEDYQRAIAYEFGNLSKFITDHGKDNDIFMLIGDHQPPILSNPDIYGKTTPVHVIVKNDKFLDTYKEYGFEDDLFECQQTVKHEALYSIFLRSFMKTYCANQQEIPDYEPNGIQI